MMMLILVNGRNEWEGRGFWAQMADGGLDGTLADGPCKMEGLSISVGLTGEGLASKALTNRDLPLAELSSRSALNPCTRIRRSL